RPSPRGPSTAARPRARTVTTGRDDRKGRRERDYCPALRTRWGRSAPDPLEAMAPHHAAPAGDATYLFLHLMKTGGTSFNAHLADIFGADRIPPPPRTDDDGPPDWIRYGSLSSLTDLPPARRAEIRVHRGHYPHLVTDLVEPDRTLTVLREPVERSISVLRQ